MVMLVLVFLLALQTVTPEALKHAEAGMEAQKQGKQAEAIAEFRKVAELMPELAAAHMNLGQAYMQGGEFVKAIEPFKRALELNPGLIGAQQGLGYSLLAA